MIIGVDGNEANFDRKVGVHQMAYEMIWGLYKNNNLAHKSNLLEDNKKGGHNFIIYLKNTPNSDLPKENSYWKYKIIRGGRVWVISKLLPELYKGGKPDILFSPNHYLPPFAPLPMVCTITDLGYLKFSGQFTKYDFWQLKYWTAISLRISKYIIAISESTQKDIVRHYKFASEKVKIIYLAADREKYNRNISEKFVRLILNKYRISKKYLVFMSTLKPSKNIEGLLEAFSQVRQRYDYQLVIVGKKGWLYETIFGKIKELGLSGDVIFTDYLPDEERAAILKAAKVFVMPSFWEGFGIDVLNAFSCGVPVVVSRAASLPEVAGKAGVYVDPNDTKSIANGIEKVLNLSSKEYNLLVEQGFKQLSKFSWEKTAEETLHILEKAVNQG